MRKFLLLQIAIISALSTTLSAQVIPKDYDTLNYRLVGFSVPENKQATEYILELWSSALSEPGNDDYVEPKLLSAKKHTENKIIQLVPEFGKNYRWRVKYIRKTKVFDSTDFYHFTVMANPFSNENISRVRIIDSATDYKDLLVFFDNTRSLYNMNGEPLWFLPVIPGVTDSVNGNIRDLKVTADGTITFMTYENVFEIDYDGNVLWRGPNDGKVSGDTTEHYHHNFTKLPGGNYMVISNLIEMKEIPAFINTKQNAKASNQEITIGSNGKHMSKLRCGVLLEYNKKGEVVWTWNSCDYLTNEDLFTPMLDGSVRPTMHLNSFWFDNKKNIFYTSYRDISRVIKAEYPSGKALAHYGENYTNNTGIQGDGMFYAPHSCGLNADGNLYLFNNNNPLRTGNDSNKNRVSTVLILKEPQTDTQRLEKVWEFGCDIDTFAGAFSTGGGNSTELNNNDYLVCMGAVGRNFIVSKDKKIIWNILIERKSGTAAWQLLSGYRISPVTGLDIKNIFNSKQ